MLFKVDQPMYAVFLREALYNILFVSMNASREIAGDAGVKSAVAVARQDINMKRLAHTLRLLPWVLGSSPRKAKMKAPQ